MNHEEANLRALPFGLNRRNATVEPAGFSEAQVFVFSDCVLKLTPAEASASSLAAAQRELDFNRQLGAELPIRIPRLLDFDDDDGIALLFEHVRTQPPPPDFLTEVAVDLRRLHEHFLGGDLPLPRASLQPTDELRRAARDYWGEQSQVDATLLSEVVALLDIAIPEPSCPTTLLHGDAHPGNAKWAGDRIVWLDWSNARLGPGPHDLSFFLQRSCPGGKHPLEVEVFAAYGGANVADSLEVAHWYELRTRLFEWPHYFEFLSKDDISGMARRVVELATVLGLTR